MQWKFTDCSHPLQNSCVPSTHSAWRPIEENPEGINLDVIDFYTSLWEACSNAGGGANAFRDDPRLSDLAKILAPNGVRFIFKPQ